MRLWSAFRLLVFLCGMHLLNPILRLAGIEVAECNFSEPGFGKTALDAHFSYVQHKISSSVAAGFGDVVDPSSLAAALVSDGGIVSSSAFVALFSREKETKCGTLPSITRFAHFSFGDDMRARSCHGHPHPASD